MPRKIPYHRMSTRLSNPEGTYFPPKSSQPARITLEFNLLHWHPLIDKQIVEHTVDYAIVGPRDKSAPIEWRFFSIDGTIGTGFWCRFAWTCDPRTGAWRAEVKGKVLSEVVPCPVGESSGCAMCCGPQFGCFLALSIPGHGVVDIISLDPGEPFRVRAYNMLLMAAPAIRQTPPVGNKDETTQEETQKLLFHTHEPNVATTLRVMYHEKVKGPNPSLDGKEYQMRVSYDPATIQKREEDGLELLLRITSGYKSHNPTLELFYGGYSKSAPESVELEIPALRFAIQNLIYERYECAPFVMPTIPLGEGTC